MLKNLRTIIWFELFYKLITIFVFLPLIGGLVWLIMNITGHPYLAPDNIGSFLINPLTWIGVIVIIIALTAYTIFDVATIIIILDAGRQKKQIKVWPAVRASGASLKNIINRHNILLPLVVLVLLPFLSLGLAFGVNRHFALPEFIGNFIENNTVLAILTGVAILLLTILVVRWMYAFHYYVLEGKNFKQARQQSAKLIKGSAIKDFLLLILVQIAYIAFVCILILIGTAIIWLINLILQGASGVLDWLNPILLAIFSLITMTLSLMVVPCIYGFISARFYKHKKEHHEKIQSVKIIQRRHVWASVAAIAVVLVGGVVYYTLGSGKYAIITTRQHPIEITAHRGFSAAYPENTMSAFRGAVENGADWIELDVQQTKDHKIVISHDNDTERMSGVYKDIWDTDYAELAKLDFQGERIATLAEVLDLANKTGIRLNIEIKRNGHDDGIEQEVVKLIRDYHQEKFSMISSLNYDTLRTVKAIDPNIQTLYVMLFAYGDVNKIPDVDGYSVEATSVSSKLIHDVHQKGSEIVAWTIDDPDNMRRLDDMNVDGIITNKLTEAKEVIEDNTNDPYTNYWSLLQYSMNI